MAVNKSIDEIKGELDEYFEFIALMNKSRPPEIQKRIDNVVKEENKTSARIKRILKIDQEAGLSEFTLYDEPEEPDESRDYARPASIEEEKPKEFLPQKKPIRPSSIISFFLKHRKLAVNFGKRTKTLDFKLLGFHKTLTLTADVYFKQIVNDTMENLLKALNYVIHNGWKSMDIRSYNSIVAYYKFAQAIVRNGHKFNYQAADEVNYKVVESFLPYYLKIVYKPEYKEIIKDSLYEILFFNPDYKPHLKQILRVTDDFLNVERRDLCFFNIILATFILVYNRFVKIDEMFAYYQITPLEVDKFNFSQKVYSEVKDYRDNLEASHIQTEQQLYILKFLNERNGFFEQNKDSKEYKILTKLYQSERRVATASSDDKKEEVPDLESQLLKVMPRIMDGFRLNYFDILVDKIPVKHQGKEVTAQLFKEYIFGGDFQRLKELSQEIKRMTSGTESIELDFRTYVNYVMTGRVEIEKEEKFCQSIKEAMQLFWDIGYKLANILFRNYKAISSKDTDLFETFKKKYTPLEDYTGSPAFIPYYFDLVSNHKYIARRKVVKILEEISYFLINFVHYFRVQEIQKLLEKREKLVNEIESYIQVRAKLG